MEWFLAGLAVVAIALAAVASTGRGGSLPDLVDDRVAPELPARDLTGDDLREAQFAVVPRGYSMSQVDELLRRLAEQLSPGGGPTAPFAVDTPTTAEPVRYGPQDDPEQ